jgi:magnesium transporter
MMAFGEASRLVKVEHVSLILGDGYVISFLEDEGDPFDEVRQRLRSANGRIRAMKADYLAYALMDAVVDHYFLAIEGIGDRIEEIDDRLLTDPRPEDIQEVHRLKRNILDLRKAVWPLREEIGALEKRESPLFCAETKVFLRDLYDHTIQAIDMLETLRDILGGLQDTYLSSMSNRMNEVMKMLTIIATIFIPLTFIAGVYGMNFEHMPELKWRRGYYLIWGIMIAIGIGMVTYFKKKKWL